MAKLLLILSLFVSVHAHAQPCFGEAECASKLVRVEVASNVLSTQTSNASLPFALPLIESAVDSSFFNDVLLRPYDLKPLGMPHSRETCLREKAEGDPLYASIRCEAQGLCADTTLHPKVREQICFKLPCAIFEGNQQVGKCGGVASIYPTGISFPEPLQIKKLKTTPKSVTIENERLKMCFVINELSLTMATAIQLDAAATQLSDRTLTVSNINPTLDQPREVCLSAKVNFAGTEPLQDVRFEVQNGVIFSDNMLREMAGQVRVDGLGGYAASDLQAIQGEVLPVLVQPMRTSIEEGLKKSLSDVLAQQVRTSVAELRTQADSGRSLRVDAASVMSEMSLANVRALDAVAVLECATLQRLGQRIPADHSCIGLPKPDLSEGTITPNTELSYFFSRSDFGFALNQSADGATNVTSESIRQRLSRIKAQLATLNLDTDWDIRDIQRYMDAISLAQTNANLPRYVELQANLSNAMTGVGLSLPDICDANNPSAHEGRSIPNCPIQVYTDLKDMNALLRKMWENGQMCESGRGPFVPERNSAGQPLFYSNGAAQGSGCFMNMSGLGCYMKEPPQLRLIPGTSRYATSVKLEKCFHNGFFGIGKFGGDLNINFSFKPKACHNGDFCVDSPKVDWKVVPGTAQFALQSGAAFNETVMNALNRGITEGLGQTIRLPLASATGVLGDVPLKSEGRVDVGAGYFGACLKPDLN
jgi:hypothetical protein